MADQIVFFQRRDRALEGSRHVITVSFRDRATAAASTPTNVRYRLDDAHGCELVGWTSASAAASVDIAITPTQNVMQNECERAEKRVLTVAADYGLSTQVLDSVSYDLENARGV